MKSIILFISLISFNVFSVEQITNMQFVQTGDVSRLILDTTGNVEVIKSDKTNEQQIILDIEGASARSDVLRPINTSEFSGGTVYVSAYKQSASKVRVVVQLRDNVGSRIEKNGNQVQLLIENRFGAFKDGVIDGPVAQAPVINNYDDGLEERGFESTGAGAPTYDVITNLTQSGEKRYIGSPITINVRSVPLAEVMNLISETSGFNIAMSEEALKRPPVTISFTNVPWDEALDTILNLNDLVAKKHSNVLQIITKKKFLSDAKKVRDEQEALKTEEPMMTKVFSVSFSKPADIQKNIEAFVDKKKGSISVDKRTNKIIVKETAENIAKMKQVIDILDVSNPQVLIEARIVEMIEGAKKEFGFQNGIEGTYTADGRNGLTEDAQGALFGFNGGSFVNPDGTGGLLSIGLSLFGKLTRLDATLQLLEEESKAKIISSPKLVTLNKKTATISTQDQRSQTVTTGTGDDIQTSYEPITADLSLNVTPTIANDGSIELDIDLKKESFIEQGTGQINGPPPNKSNNNLKTSVVVDNGSTIVIGGIYQTTESQVKRGVPLLRKIPLIGWLFSNGHRPIKSRTELMIFLTPRIINQKDSNYAKVID